MKVSEKELSFEKHDNALIAEIGDICSISRSNLKSKAMQSAWDKKCIQINQTKEVFLERLQRD